MAQCPGKRGAQTCNRILYRCKKCGNVGCESGKPSECGNQAFLTGSKCVKCGTSGQKENFK